ncbi:MAG: nucleotidyltransferase domain-containing protein [Candidatus Woesearchaeota archaeon]
MVKTVNLRLQESPESYRKVLYNFFSFPQKSISLNDLSKNIRASKTATKTAVTRLINEGFLKKEVVGNAWRLSADSKDPFMVTRKIPYNLELIYESGIIARVYNKIPEARAIILFGSYRWGTDNEKSDIDIGVEVLGNHPMIIETLITFDNFGFRKNVRVNLHIFSRTKIDLNLFTNIANGIVLDGLLEVHP